MRIGGSSGAPYDLFMARQSAAQGGPALATPITIPSQSEVLAAQQQMTQPPRSVPIMVRGAGANCSLPFIQEGLSETIALIVQSLLRPRR